MRRCPLDAHLSHRARALVLLAGCGGGPPPDDATSRGLVAKTVLDWHRAQADGDGEAGCELLTGKAQAKTVKFDRKLAAIGGNKPPENCVEAVATALRGSARLRELMLNTRVDAVRIEGERATATAHTSAVINGVVRQVPPADLRLRWEDGHWLMD